MLSPDAVADAASHKAAIAPKGSKRTRESIARKARLVALACNVRDAKRISMRIEGA